MLRLVLGAAALAALDPDSAYHLGQIGGMVLLYHAVATGEPACLAASGRSSERVTRVEALERGLFDREVSSGSPARR